MNLLQTLLTSVINDKNVLTGTGGKSLIDIVCYKLVYSFVLNYFFVLSFIYRNEVVFTVSGTVNLYIFSFFFLGGGGRMPLCLSLDLPLI